MLRARALSLLISAILAPFFLKRKKISSTGPMKFGKTAWRESCAEFGSREDGQGMDQVWRHEKENSFPNWGR